MTTVAARLETPAGEPIKTIMLDVANFSVRECVAGLLKSSHEMVASHPDYPAILAYYEARACEASDDQIVLEGDVVNYTFTRLQKWQP